MIPTLKTKLNMIIKKTWKYATALLLVLSVISVFWFIMNKPKETKAGWWNPGSGPGQARGV
jgi:hypothetical protein